ncbi:MAG: response regulator [Candidatus Saccharimonadales bacterium]
MPKIMLVEDDNNLREIYGERLMAEGYDIVSAGDGEEALALAVKEKPDLIVSDVMMPKISGFDMLDILRQTPETKNTKVIMMTALSQTEDKDRADKLGADKYLVKSQVTLEDVARVVHDLIYGEDAEATQVAEAAATPVATDSAAPASEPTVAPVVVASEPVAVEPTVAPAAPIVAEPVAAPVAVTPDPAVTDATAAVSDDTTVVAPTADNPVPTAVDDDNEGTPIVMPPAPAEPAVVVPSEPVAPVAEPVVTAPEPVIPTATPAEEPEVTAPVANPMLGATDAVTNPSAPVVSTDSAAAQSTQDETAAIAEQINQFVAGQPAEEPAHEAPLVEPSEQDIIHAQNEVEDPSVIKPETPVDPTVPSVGPVQTDVPEPASARKKVISPINDPTQAPNIYELYEKEMAAEAANTPVETATAGTEVEATTPDTNPMTVATTEAPAPLQQVDTSQIEGLTVGEEQPLATPTAEPVTQPAEQAPATEQEAPVDPNNPANFAL